MDQALTPKPGRDAPIAPSFVFAAIGDIHGRVDLLDKLLRLPDPDLPIICVDDYIDRGEHSAEVLRLLSARSDVTCLMGNHEDISPSFLRNSAAYGPACLRNGGLQTLIIFKTFVRWQRGLQSEADKRKSGPYAKIALQEKDGSGR